VRTGSMRCDAKRAFGSRCPGVLVVVPDAIGRVSYRCEVCARRKAGVCESCPRAVVGTKGKALRCAMHEKLAVKARQALYRQRHLEERRAADRVQWRKRRQLRWPPPLSTREKGLRAAAARNAALTPERRREIGKHAITTRWARVKGRAA
jgi:molybdenum cofactor biosynthesis enzyme MoaA